MAARDYITERVATLCHFRDYVVQNASFCVDAPKAVKALPVFSFNQCIDVGSVCVEVDLIYVDAPVYPSASELHRRPPPAGKRARDVLFRNGRQS